MSYLDSPRVHFSGGFQADVSTINNDIRMYQNASFVPEYQQLNQNGSWNPEGTAVFRLLDCSVTGGFLNGQASALSGITVQNADRRAPGKLVDLDPQQQMVSEIWGMQVRLVDASGQTMMKGEFEPAAFMNLWLRQQKGVLRDQQLAAYYQSVLEDVQWYDVSSSPLLEELRSTTEDGKLSIGFNVYGYGRDSNIPRYTMGHLTGTIGPYFKGEPKHFTRGRQLIYTGSFPAPSGGMGTLQAKVAADMKSLTVDLGNSFPIETADSGLMDIGQVSVGVLKTSPAQVQTTVTQDQVIIIGEVPYLVGDWYHQTAGVQTFDLTANTEAQGLLPKCPIVLISPATTAGSYNVRLQETIDGVYVRADKYVFRLNPGETGSIELYADRFGAPLQDAEIVLSTTAGFMGGSGGGSTITPSARPAAAIPNINTPLDAIQYPSTVTTNADGYVAATVTVSAPGPGSPRGYMPHQMYGVGYQLSTQPAQYVSNPMNYVSILAYSGKQVPETPTWYADVQQIFTQYGNLYPIMGRYIVNLRDYHAVVQRLDILTLAFSLPIKDPNHMPVTRDLGAGDRATILAWLGSRGPNGLPPLGTPSQLSDVTAPGAIDHLTTDSGIDLPPEQRAGKTAVILEFQHRAKLAKEEPK